MNDETKQQFKVKIADAVNYCGIDAETDTPDYVLAEYLVSCLEAYSQLVYDKKIGVISDKLAQPVKGVNWRN